MSSSTLPVRQNTIGRRLSWQVSLLSLLAFLALPGVAFMGLQVTLRDVQTYLQTPRDSVAEAFAAQLEGAASDLWATGDALGVYGDAAQLLQRALARQEVGFFELLWVRPDGRVLASAHRSTTLPETQLSAQPWLETVQAGKLYVGNLDYTAESIPLLEMAVPVRDEAQQFTATLLARLDLTALLKLMAVPPEGGAGYVVYVTDENGTVLLHQDVQLMQQRPPTLSAASLEQLSAATMPVYTQAAEQTVFAIGAALPVVPWYVVVQQSVLEALMPFIYQTLFLLLSLASIIYLIVNAFTFTQREIVVPLQRVLTGVLTLEHDLTYRIETAAQGELASLASAINGLAAQLNQTINALEQQVDERTRGLLVAAEVSRSTTAALALDALLQQVVNLMRDRFGLYYVGLFLLDETAEQLILQAGTGEPGKQMLAANYRFRRDDTAPVVQCLTEAQARIVLDVGADAHRFNNPWLPRTRSEMALPLRSQRRVIGAMTVQSEREAAFNETNILVMQTMVDQVAAAIDNAQLYARVQESLHEMELLQQRYLGEAWAEFLHRRPLWGYRQTREGLTPLGQEPLDGVPQALARRETLITESSETSAAPQVVVPLRFRDQFLGALGFAVAEGAVLSDEQIAFVESVAEQFGLAAENLRLVETTQRLAAREHMVGEVSARIRESLDLDTVLRTAVEQIRRAMQTPEVTIRLRMAEVDDEKRA